MEMRTRSSGPAADLLGSCCNFANFLQNRRVSGDFATVGCWADRRQTRGLTVQEAIGAEGAYGRLGGAAAAQGGGICLPRSKHSLD
jgi:hypothetical protein